MRWGDETDRVNEKATLALGKVFGPTGLFVVAIITAFVMLSAAGSKWT
jgi:hypothetical protein